MKTEKHPAPYIPALGFHWLTPLYDPLLRWTLRESVFKCRLVEQARIEGGHRVLDLGCGTGTLTLLIKRLHPGAEVFGLDGDAKVLQVAEVKAAKAGLEVTFVRGIAFDLPYADNSFERVLSSLLFHHLTRENKVRALREAFRVLRPGGQLHIADWGRPQNGFMRGAFLLVQMLDGFRTTADNVAGMLPHLFGEAGFVDVEQTTRYGTILGTLALYQAKKPELAFL